MNPNGYIIDFTIPRGDTGPTGPTGPAGTDNFVRAFGYLYNQTRIDSIFLPNNQALQVALPEKPIRLNVFYPSNNTIGFLTEGAFFVSYSILLQIPDASASNPVTVTSILRLNGQVSTIPPVEVIIKDDSTHYISNTFVVNRAVNDNIDFIISADQAVDFNYTTAFLCAVKISDRALP